MLVRMWINSINCCWECKWVATWEDSLTVSYEVYFLPYDLAAMFLGFYLKEVKAYTCVQKTCTWVCSAALFINCRNLEATKMYFRRWMDKSSVVHPESRMLFRAKKNWVVKPWIVMEEPCMHITKWKDPIWKHYNIVWFQSGKVTSDC